MWDFAFCGGETRGFDKFGVVWEVWRQGFGTVFLYIDRDLGYLSYYTVNLCQNTTRAEDFPPLYYKQFAFLLFNTLAKLCTWIKSMSAYLTNINRFSTTDKTRDHRISSINSGD